MATRKMQERVVERYLDAVWSIASSRYVGWFVVGYTCRGGRGRFGGYQQRGFANLIVVADGLTKAQALYVEERLQRECKAGAAYGPPYKRKYHPDHRRLAYVRSAGRGSPDEAARIHSVYMAWVEP